VGGCYQIQYEIAIFFLGGMAEVSSCDPGLVQVKCQFDVGVLVLDVQACLH